MSTLSNFRLKAGGESTPHHGREGGFQWKRFKPADGTVTHQDAMDCALAMKMEAGELEFLNIKSLAWLYNRHAAASGNVEREEDLHKRKGLDRLGCGPGKWSGP